MSGLSRKNAGASYDRMSRWYSAFTFFENGVKARGMQMLNVTPGEKIVEIGMGTGDSLVHFAKAATGSGLACGLDVSGGMCHVASHKLQKAGISDTACIILGDAASLPFPANSLDAVFLCFTLELFDDNDRRDVLRECGRVLRKGGRVCVVAMAKRAKVTLIGRLYSRAQDALPRYVDCQPVTARTELEGAGFTIRGHDEASVFGLPVDVVIAVCQ